MSRLRRARPAGSTTTLAGSYLLAVRPDQVDAGRLDQTVRRARSAFHAGELEEAAVALGEAMSLRRGRVSASWHSDSRGCADVYLKASRAPVGDRVARRSAGPPPRRSWANRLRRP